MDAMNARRKSAFQGQVGPPKPCVDCGHDAIMRDPITFQPRHKVCADKALADLIAANGGGPA